MRRVYLAGPIFRRSDAETFGWRVEATHLCEKIGWEVENPAERDYRGREAEHYVEIVENDLASILECSAVLVNAQVPSWGTAMEVRYASVHGLPVFAFVRRWETVPSADVEPVSPWLRYHARICSSLSAAVREIEKL